MLMENMFLPLPIVLANGSGSLQLPEAASFTQHLLQQQNPPMGEKCELDGTEDAQLLNALKAKEQRKCQDLLDQLVQQMMAALPAQNVAKAGQFVHQQEDLNAAAFPHWNVHHLPTGHVSSVSASSSAPESPSSTSNVEQIGEQIGRKESRRRFSTSSSSSEARPHKCEQCQKAFRFKSNLFEHKSLHLDQGQGRTPFVCPFCAKTCRLKGNLKKHLQVHVGNVHDLERLWKRSFSRQSGRPRKNAPHAPLPKPGDDLGLVPVPLTAIPVKGQSRHQSPPLQWTFAEGQLEANGQKRIVSPMELLFGNAFQVNLPDLSRNGSSL